jgi:hypothetical protein
MRKEKVLPRKGRTFSLIGNCTKNARIEAISGCPFSRREIHKSRRFKKL